MEIDLTKFYDLIEKLKCEPLDFSLSETKILTDALKENLLPDTIIRKTAVQILDLSENGIFRSSAADGFMGYLNQRSRAKRQDRFWDRIQDDFRKTEGNIVVLAEGDSWFEHPFLQDIIDHINRHEDIAVFSLAYTADWLDNILYQGEYVDMLSVIKPDVFLVSAGGNDLLGDKKIGIMCRGINEGKKEKNIQDYYDCIYTKTIPLRFQSGLINNNDADDISKGVKYLTKEFFGFLNIMQWQYDYLFTCIRAKYHLMPIFTQSYDFATPQTLIQRPRSLAYWHQRPLNEILQSGKWIETAMRNAEIYDPETMHQVIKAMLYLFKAMVIETSASYSYVYHIDSQGLTKRDEWFDEIHIKSHKFQQVGQTYAEAMREAVKLRNQLISNQTITAQVKPVYRSTDTVNNTTFEESMAAFKRERKPLSPLFLRFLVLFSILVFGILYWFSQPFACKLSTIVAVVVLLTKVYSFFRVRVLSRLYSKK